ncbi:MAG: hypothetical protein M1825_005512 [Sarcosagium campestre]|nr:MAG: hypothetical protein M1825_005512 [Sarcosagium campestre]
MDTNALIDLAHEVQDQLWVDKVNETYGTGRLCQWVSTFHPDKLCCHLDGTFHHGAFNAGMKMVFSDSTAWMVRFPRAGMVCEDYADEKVAVEVSALDLIHKSTVLPFQSRDDLLKDPNADRPTRLMREDISDSDIEVIYRQMANFWLQLFKLDFDRISSLPLPRAEAQSLTPPRPLTYKAHTILQNGGVTEPKGLQQQPNISKHVVGQDWEQLVRQPNSIDGLHDAKLKYVAFKVLKALIPELVNAKYDRCKFKLICDDLGLANLIVRGREDLTVVGVVDLEWSYIGPAQMFGSAPWWLLQDRPVNSAWDCLDNELPNIATRYLKERELSTLVKWSQASGAMWLHMLLSSGFNDYYSFPFTQLRKHLGPSAWAKFEKGLDDAEELEAFAKQKVSDLDKYDEALEKTEEDKALVDSGKMTKEEFIANTLMKPGCSPPTSSFVVIDEISNDEGLLHKMAAFVDRPDRR